MLNIKVPQVPKKEAKKTINKTFRFSQKTLDKLEELSSETGMKPNALITYLIQNTKEDTDE